MAVPVFRPTVKRKDMGSVLSCIVSDKIGPGEISRDLVSGFVTSSATRGACLLPTGTLPCRLPSRRSGSPHRIP